MSLSLLVLLVTVRANGAPASVVVEIDVAAERIVDARSARRLIALELSDVVVPTRSAARPSELFVRVLGREADALRLELWERGEFHGARVLSGAGENPQLFARRVALAAAELGRRLARKREAALHREARLRALREALEKSRRERTQEGPVALRSELGIAMVPGKLWLAGPRVNAELTLRGALRLDLGAEAGAGSLYSAGGAALYGATLGPAYRFALTPWLDADWGVRAGAFLLEVPAARSLDAIPWQQGSWTALAGVAGRLELRVSRQVRAAVGVEGGALLRSITYVGDGGEQQLRGSWLSTSLGVVITPP